VVEITDISSSDSPLKISGHVSFEEVVTDIEAKARYSLDATLTNVSSKPIMSYHIAMSVSPSIGPGVNAQYTDDRFFRDEMIAQPGGAALLQETASTWRAVPIANAAPESKVAVVKAKVVFVQFADGSRFGDEKWGAKIRNERVGAISDLNAATSAYASGISVNEGLQSALNNSKANFTSINSVILSHVKDILDSKGATAALAEMQKLLKTADQRKSYL